MNSVEEIQKSIKEAVDWLIEEDMGCVTIKLDDRLAICVGWLPGYGEEIRDDCIQSKSEPTFAINAGIKVWTSDDMRTDYEFINMPYYENGDVIETDISIEEKDKEDNYQHVAKWLLDQYESIKDLDIDENGLIHENSDEEEDEPTEAEVFVGESLEEGKIDDDIENRVEELRDTCKDMSAKELYAEARNEHIMALGCMHGGKNEEATEHEINADAYRILAREKESNESLNESEQEFKVQIYNSEGDEDESFNIFANSKEEAQKIIDDIECELITEGAFNSIEVRSGSKLLYTIHQIGDVDFFYDNKDFMDGLTFKLIANESLKEGLVFAPTMYVVCDTVDDNGGLSFCIRYVTESKEDAIDEAKDLTIDLGLSQEDEHSVAVFEISGKDWVELSNSENIINWNKMIFNSQVDGVEVEETLKEDITKDSEEYKKAWIDALHNFRDAYSKLRELMTTAGFDSNEFINTKQAREAMDNSFAPLSLDELHIVEWCNEVEDNLSKWTPGQWLEESLKKEKETLKETWDGENVIDDLIERAQAMVEEGQDVSEAVSNAIDEGLIYTNDIYTLAQHYGSIADSELVSSFYDDLYNDIMNGVEIPEDEDEDDIDWNDEEVEEESLQEDNSSKGSLIAQTVAKEFKGQVGPFGDEDPKINGNELTLYSQGGEDIFRFNDDGSIDFVNVEEAVHEWVDDGEIEEDEVEDYIKEYSHFNSLEDLVSSGLSWFTYLSKQTQRKVKEILSK